MHEYILYRISITIYNYNIYIYVEISQIAFLVIVDRFFLVMTKHFHRWLHQYLVGHHLSKFMIVDKFPSCDAKRLQNKQPAWNNRFSWKTEAPPLASHYYSWPNPRLYTICLVISPIKYHLSNIHGNVWLRKYNTESNIPTKLLLPSFYHGCFKFIFPKC